jgi:uncharacterized protein
VTRNDADYRGPVTSTSSTMTVSRLAMTSVKGFGLQEVGELEVTERGVPGDRALFMADEDGKLFSATRSAAFLPYWARYDVHSGELTVGRGSDTVLSEPLEPGERTRAHFFADRHANGRFVGGRWDTWISEVAGRPLRLVLIEDPEGGYDVHPVTVVSEASVAELGHEADGSPLDVRRFRMTVTVDGVAPFAEDGWQGRTLSLGDAVLRVGGPVKRCAAIQQDPDGAKTKVNALRLINDRRGTSPSELGSGLLLGVYAHVLRPGTVRVGERAELEAAEAGAAV